MLVAATDRGVADVRLGDAPEPLIEGLHARLPSARLTRDDEGLAALVARVVAAAEGESPAPDLPLDLQGTAFQRRVWDELRRIPWGERATYAEIAARVGAPAAVRAVGTACGRNEVSVLIPCHRAVRKDGGLGGYRWGLDRKIALLANERGNPVRVARKG